jgi:peptidoglycan L-alanyl-D-glutamate endopeptidase CwlK
MKDSISIPRVELLHPKLRNEVKQLIEKAESIIDNNLAIRVVQGLRTIEEQNKIFNQPTDGIDNDGDGKIDERDEFVSRAKGGASYHNYGLAIDITFLYYNELTKKYEYREKDSWIVGKNHLKLQTIFKEYGWKWGGDFKSIKDTPHFERTFGHNIEYCRSKYNSDDIFFNNNIKYIKI